MSQLYLILTTVSMLLLKKHFMHLSRQVLLTEPGDAVLDKFAVLEIFDG